MARHLLCLQLGNEAADLVARRLVRSGIDDALREAGAQPGEDVQIGGLFVRRFVGELLGEKPDAVKQNGHSDITVLPLDEFFA